METKTFSAEPTISIKRADGSYVHFYRCIEDPDSYDVKFDGMLSSWTEYLQQEMNKGNVSKK